MQSFKISGLPGKTFRKFFSKSDDELAALGMRRCIADVKPGYPCRISMIDAEIGETLILGPYEHHAVAGPYRASGPIYVREAASSTYESINQIPEVLQRRLISVRAYDPYGLMRDAAVVEGTELEVLIERFFNMQEVEYLHVHNARPGCYACRIDRA